MGAGVAGARSEAAGTRIVLLYLQELGQEGQGELVLGKSHGASSLILETGEALLLEDSQDVPDVLVGQFQAGSDALLVPALVVHPDHREARPVGVLELVKVRHWQR